MAYYFRGFLCFKQSQGEVIVEEATSEVWDDGDLKMLDSNDKEPVILEEIEIEAFLIEGICGVY